MKERSVGATRNAPLEMPPDEFRAAGHALVDRVAELLGTMRERKITTGLTVPQIRDLINASAGLPETGAKPDALLSQVSEWLIDYSLYNGHPKFLGYITASPAPIGMLADLLAAAVNPNVGAWTLSPVATEIEAQTVRWIAELLGYPSNCGGVLVSGGNMANFIGIYAALRSAFPSNSAAPSSADLSRATLYASRETHTWIEKALDMFGFPRDALRSTEVDSTGRLSLSALESHLASDLKAGRIPVAIVGNAGTVSTGAIDPLPAMADLCRQFKVWFHVDGAYGGFAAIVKEAPDDLRGLVRADSLAVDPHKWLYSPLEAGCALVRDPEKHRAAFSYHPTYYQFGEATNFFDYGPQNSRGFRALKVWMALKHAGRQGYERMITDDIGLARDLRDRLSRDANFQVFTCSLSITTFRYVPADYRNRIADPATQPYLNELNKTLQAKLEAGGEVFVSNAIVDDCYLLRACIVNFRTSRKDIAEIPGIIARYGQQVHRESQLAT